MIQNIAYLIAIIAVGAYMYNTPEAANEMKRRAPILTKGFTCTDIIINQKHALGLGVSNEIFKETESRYFLEYPDRYSVGTFNVPTGSFFTTNVNTILVVDQLLLKQKGRTSKNHFVFYPPTTFSYVGVGNANAYDVKLCVPKGSPSTIFVENEPELVEPSTCDYGSASGILTSGTGGYGWDININSTSNFRLGFVARYPAKYPVELFILWQGKGLQAKIGYPPNVGAMPSLADIVFPAGEGVMKIKYKSLEESGRSFLSLTKITYCPSTADVTYGMQCTQVPTRNWVFLENLRYLPAYLYNYRFYQPLAQFSVIVPNVIGGIPSVFIETPNNENDYDVTSNIIGVASGLITDKKTLAFITVPGFTMNSVTACGNTRIVPLRPVISNLQCSQVTPTVYVDAATTEVDKLYTKLEFAPFKYRLPIYSVDSSSYGTATVIKTEFPSSVYTDYYISKFKRFRGANTVNKTAIFENQLDYGISGGNRLYFNRNPGNVEICTVGTGLGKRGAEDVSIEDGIDRLEKFPLDLPKWPFPVPRLPKWNPLHHNGPVEELTPEQVKNDPTPTGPALNDPNQNPVVNDPQNNLEVGQETSSEQTKSASASASLSKMCLPMMALLQ